MEPETQADLPRLLSLRQREILELLRLGLTDVEIAERLDISVSGVRYHVTEVINKLGVENRHEAATWPERPPWWATALAPIALFWRKTGAALPVQPSSAALALSGGLFAAALGGLGLIAFLVLRGGDAGATIAEPTAVDTAAGRVLGLPPDLSALAATGPLPPPATPSPLGTPPPTSTPEPAPPPTATFTPTMLPPAMPPLAPAPSMPPALEVACGGNIAFQRFEYATGEVWRDIYVLDAGGLHNLTNGPDVIDPPSLSPPAEPTRRRSINVEPAFSPDGSKIAFLSNRLGEADWEIYLMNPDGSGVARITNTPGFESHPTWSPDGSQIAYSSHRTGSWEIYVMNAGGGAHANLSKHPSSDNWPTWSPDGTKIAFTSNRDENSSIYVMNTDGSGVTQLTSGTPSYDGTPAWSPDGTKIAFGRAHSDLGWLNGEIYVMNADGSGQTRLTTNTIDEGVPAWSPDGSKIAFVAAGSPPPDASFYDIYVMNADGSGRTRLTDDTSKNDLMPNWSGPPSLEGDGCSASMSSTGQGRK